MKKATRRKKNGNGLRKEYDLKSLKGGVRGKYHRRYAESTHLVPLDPDVASAFPTAKDVNDALRGLVSLASRCSRTERRSGRS